jgi:single-strand DNA-binding protein
MARSRRESELTASSELEEGVSPLNVVRVRGRLAVAPDLRDLPSGDVVATFRIVVPRPPVRAGVAGSTVKVDTLDCAAFRADVRRRVARWHPGDVLEVEGSLRRRFFRAGGAAASRYEIEVTDARRVATAG